MNKLPLRCRTIAAVAAVTLSTLPAMTESADAQDMAAVRRAIVSPDGSRVFAIDSTGRTRGGSTLEITRLDNSGALVGFYYPDGSPRPRSTNVTGSITIIRPPFGGGNAIRISIAALSTAVPIPGGGRGIVSRVTLDGALRLGSSSNPSFMAGTSTNSGFGGPYPFCATLVDHPL